MMTKSSNSQLGTDALVIMKSIIGLKQFIEEKYLSFAVFLIDYCSFSEQYEKREVEGDLDGKHDISKSNG